MDTISQKKVVISYLITSVIVLFVSAVMSLSRVYGINLGPTVNHFPIGLVILLQMCIILSANFLLHMIFYYGGFSTSPIIRGVVIGACLGVAYFLLAAFAFGVYDINGDSIHYLVSGMSGRLVEYGTGGVATAIISVSDIHRWGLLRAF